ncbi:TetR/AcrR family transcriptional regulator [Mycobacterium sp. JS623]|uniref:TetR/AcrR family transcriptional regulator n=1 Tax=Mycobacterium sp. JS623 TaxID=212767 RepID=UPI00059C82A9|nr:TetR/AcrR family transcriptional regulator [Mycobacterium sp. JS623]
MTVITSDSRDRMIQSAALLFRENGYSGTGFRDVIEHSGAPRGSIYHHFPGGKEQLAAETVAWAAAVIERRITRAAESGDPIAALGIFVESWREVLEDSNFRAGCPVVAVAAEADAGSTATDAAAAAFGRWQDLIGRTLLDSGVSRTDSRRLATTVVAAIEGAILLCRVRRDIRPLRDVHRALEATLRTAISWHDR